MKARPLITVFAVSALVVAGVWAWRLGRQSQQRDDVVFERGIREIAYASTRGDFDDGELNENRDPYGYRLIGTIPASTDITIVVHGLNNSDRKAINRFGLARESLVHNGYPGEVVGFSWDGETNWDPFGATGYRTARKNARATGRKLAQFVTDLHALYPQAQIRLIGYSMGAVLVMHCLEALDEDPKLKSAVPLVKTVHLVGAAIDNEYLQTDGQFGPVIERQCGTLYNYFSPQDDKLGTFFKVMEADRAIGRTNLEDPKQAPRNFVGRNVSAELPPVDDHGRPTQGPRGRNHSAYLGVRDNDGTWCDDGAMNIVAQDMQFSRP